MGARLVLNLRGSDREDVMPTSGGRSTTDDTVAYELHAKGLRMSRPLQGDRLVFASIRAGESFVDEEEEERHLSPQERMRLNQIKSSRVGGKTWLP